MIYTFQYESDQLAEERGLDSCVLVEVELEVTFDVEGMLEYTVTRFVDLDKGEELNDQSADFILEITKQSKLDTEVNYDDIYAEWCGWIIDQETDLSHLEDRDE